MEFLTVPETATLLRIGEPTASKPGRDGRLPAGQVGNHWRIERGALEEWFAQGGSRLRDEGEAS